MHRRLSAFLLLAALLPAADWTRYRGPNGTGATEATALPAEIGPGRNMLWKVASPKGNSSPIVVKDHIFFTGHEGDRRLLLCYHAATGAELWRQGIDKPRTELVHPLNGPTTPTPATDGKYVFAFFPEFGVIAYDFAGKEQWRVPLGPFAAIQGIASSPVYAEGNVIVLLDSPEESYLLGLDARSGKQVFRTERTPGFLGSYSTPSLYKPKSGPLQLVVAGAAELTGYQARTGERLWWARGVTNGPAALPLVAGDAVFTMEPAGEGAPTFQQVAGPYDKDKNGKVELSEVTGQDTNSRIMYRIFKSIDKHLGDGDGAMSQQEWDKSFDGSNPGGGLVRVRLGGKGDVSRTHVEWRHLKGLPYVTAPLLVDNSLYIVKNGGIVSIHDARTGALVKQERLKDAPGDYYASPVAADGKMYFVNKEGKVTVIKPGPASWETLGSGDLDDQVIATPAIAGNRLFIRTQASLYSFGLRR